MQEPFKEHYKRWGFLRDLLLNNIEDINNNKLLNHFKNSAEESFNCVMVVVIDNYYSLIANSDNKEAREIRFSTYDYIEQCLKQKFTIPVSIEDNIFAIIFQNNQKAPADYSVELGLHMKNYVKNHSGLTVSIGIGRTYNRIEDLFFSYKDALLALNHKFYLGNSQVLHYECIPPFCQDFNFLSTEKHSHLMTKTMALDIDGTYEIIDMILKEAASKSVNPFLVKIRFIDSLIDIICSSNQFEQSELNSRINEISNQIFKTDTVFELQEQLNIAAREIINGFKLSRKNINRQVFESAINYIYSNYNKNITLEDVAKHVYISPYYFSHGFKEYIGISFVEYLKRVRIEEAKKLLLTTDMSIRKICNRVGYSDPNYFSRVFKSVMGVSPSSFYGNRTMANRYQA